MERSNRSPPPPGAAGGGLRDLPVLAERRNALPRPWPWAMPHGAQRVAVFRRGSVGREAAEQPMFGRMEARAPGPVLRRCRS
ncbi:hypothetical protein [Muricoccus nepalensis]|uniref:hypothetical protein n=1 Tax=Muricoccus nepalensis TaxID=1854500 RepID=UPI00112C59F6|nr:hypothetical protein [Roseomonas nepalensis]